MSNSIEVDAVDGPQAVGAGRDLRLKGQNRRTSGVAPLDITCN
jgi:hypothetical protein